MIFPMVSSVNGFPASGLHADLLKQPGQRRVHPAHPDGGPEPWAVRDVAPQHLHMPAHQRPLPLPSRRSPLSATTSITSVRVSSLECLIALSSSPPPPDFAHKPVPVFPVEGDPPVSNPSLCPHVLRSSEYVDIYVTGLSARLGKRSHIVRGSPVRRLRMAGGGTPQADSGHSALFFRLSGFRQFIPAYRRLYYICARRTARLQ